LLHAVILDVCSLCVSQCHARSRDSSVALHLRGRIHVDDFPYESAYKFSLDYPMRFRVRFHALLGAKFKCNNFMNLQVSCPGHSGHPNLASVVHGYMNWSESPKNQLKTSFVLRKVMFLRKSVKFKIGADSYRTGNCMCADFYAIRTRNRTCRQLQTVVALTFMFLM
jgi:hypothetical protein